MPKCPYCEGNVNPENIKHIRRKSLITLKDDPNIYYCPHCEKILGFAKAFLE